jgi:ATP-binding cassette subfamily B protein
MWNNFAQHFQHEARVDTYDALQRRSTDFFDNKQTGEVMSILNNVHESGALVSQPERVAFW